jgi:hypothetical protein
LPLSTIGSYMPTMQEFIVHWTHVNSAVSPGVFTLAGGYILADFTADRAAIDAVLTDLEDVDNERQGASADRDRLKGERRDRLSQYRFTVLGLLPGTPYSRTLPLLPRFRANQAIFLKAMDDMANGWGRINTDSIPNFTPPLLLSGGYTLADHAADLAELRAAYLASTNAHDNVRQQRSVCHALLGPAKARMLQYRNGVRGILPSGHELLTTIPAVTPPPGATPDPVHASGIWNPLTGEIDLTWTPSANPHLDHYSIRTAPGPTYKAAEESVVATVPKTETSFSTLAGLIFPGATALFRVYVVLTTMNERGSNTVSVTREG